MALECRKMSNAGLVVSSLSQVLPHDANDQQAPVLSIVTPGRDQELSPGLSRKKEHANIDIREVYFLIMHFLSKGPCLKASDQLRDELEQFGLLPRRYHAWYSRSGTCSGELDDDGISVPLNYPQLLERFSFIERNHLVMLLEELLNRNTACHPNFDAKYPTAADASTLLGTGSVSLLHADDSGFLQLKWPRKRAGQLYGLTLREVGGGLAKHQRAPAIRAASYGILQPSVLVNRIQKIKTFRGHRNAVYCAIFDKSGEYIITGSDDRLVKIWSTATGFCLCSSRGHEGDITDLAVSANNLLLASASNDCFIRVWRFPDGCPVSVLKGHVNAVTAIAFSPRQGCEYLLLSASDDGTCRIWDARDSSRNPRIYTPKPEGQEAGVKINELGQPSVQPKTQIICCAFNASGTVFVTGSSDRLARVWDACKWSDEEHSGPYNEFDTLKGHEDDVNYVQFSGCAPPSRPMNMDCRPVNVGVPKNERIARFRNSWFGYENIVSCSRDGSAIIWVPRPRKYHGKSKWMKGYHLRVPPPPMPPQPPRGVPRQRLLPTPRGVNMIVWSLDNRYVLAAIMDCRICVWNAVDGGLVHSLTGHTKSTFVLDVHPCDPRLAMSAGYDGRVIIWDIWEGRSIHEFKMGDFHLVDGKFSPDGTSIIISDEVGQIYLLATGEGRTQKDAKYDQFFLGDYRPLARDVHGNVLDQETQITPHARNMRDLLCDANMIPYAEPYQSTYQQRRLGALGISWHPPPAHWVAGLSDDSSYLTVGFPLLPPPHEDEDDLHQEGVRWVEQPLDEEAMEWEQDSVDDAGSDYTLSFENACDEDERDCSLSSSEDFPESVDEEDFTDEDELGQNARLRRSERNKKKEEEAVASAWRGSKRKHKDNNSDYSLRRSKRHKRNKKLSSSKRGSDVEQSRRRPRRLAARNARLFFSRIGAEENAQDESEFSEGIDSEGDQQSSRQGIGKEDDQKKDLEETEEASVAEAEPSRLEWTRPTRSNPSGRPRFSTEKSSASKGQASSPMAGAAVCSSEDVLEEQVDASLDLRGTAPVNSGHQQKIADSAQISSMGTSNREQNFDTNQVISREDWDMVCSPRGKQRQGSCSPIAHKSPSVECLYEIPSVGNESLHHEGDHYSIGDQHEECFQLSDGLQQPEDFIKVNDKMSSHNMVMGERTIEDDDGFCSLSETVNTTRKRKPSDGSESKSQKRDSIHDMLEDSLLQDNNETLEELMDEAHFSNDSFPTSKRLIMCIASNQEEQEGSSKFLHNENRGWMNPLSTCSDLHTAFKTEQSKANLLSENIDFVPDDAVALSALAVEGDDGDYCSEKASEYEDDAPLIGSSITLGKLMKTNTESSHKHQPVGSSWQHNSPTCLWLRQRNDETEDVESSASSETESPDKNKAGGSGLDIESAGHACHLKLSFKRGKRQAAKPKRKPEVRSETPAAVEIQEATSDDDEVKDVHIKPALEQHESGRDEDEFLGKMNVTLTYVRTRRHCNVDKSGKSDQDKEGDDGNDGVQRLERRGRLRYSVRSKRFGENDIPGKPAFDTPRKMKKFSKRDSWLMLTKVEDGGRYIPQLGDEVAYVLQGHDEFPKLNQLEDRGIPKSLRSQLRAVEICQVIGIEYKTLPGFTGVSCRLTLELIDEECEAVGKTFRLSLPELIDFPDFLVDKKRYEASLRRNWTKRDRCKVWWGTNAIIEDEKQKPGEWFSGRIIGVGPKSAEFPDSPWESCLVQYSSDPTIPYRHSPWELFDLDSSKYTSSFMNEATRLQLLSVIERIEASSDNNQDEYGLRAVDKLLHKNDFLNKTLVPLNLDIIKDRLISNYYRSVNAVRFDVELLIRNIEDYLYDEDLIDKVKSLASKLFEEI